MKQKKKILILDVPCMVSTLAQFIDRWGYEPIGISSVDSIEETIIRNHIDLIVLANEMTLKGPSLDDWQKGEELKVDFEFGFKTLQRLQKQNITLPIITFTTDDLEKTKWLRNDDGSLRLVVLEKTLTDAHLEDLKKAIEEFLGEGLVTNERR